MNKDRDLGVTLKGLASCFSSIGLFNNLNFYEIRVVGIRKGE